MSERVVVFAPLPMLTVTVEERRDQPDIHLHAGGQGVWQARMINALGVPVTLCGFFGGETGRVVQRLIVDEGIDARSVERDSRNGAYIHDRRAGRRVEWATMPGDPLSRHEVDELYNVALVEGAEYQRLRAQRRRRSRDGALGGLPAACPRSLRRRSAPRCRPLRRRSERGRRRRRRCHQGQP